MEHEHRGDDHDTHRTNEQAGADYAEPIVSRPMPQTPEQLAAAYAAAMEFGAQQYADVLQRLRERGLNASFTQTGGMCAAISVTLTAKQYLLVTDYEEPLSWDRAEHRGWHVGLHSEDYENLADYSTDPLASAASEDGSVQALLPLIDDVLKGCSNITGDGS